MGIGLSTDTEFIKKLTKVVEANLEDESFGVKELSTKVRMSRSHIHRRLKSINNQSVTQFIREIRLNKAKEMLQNDLGTVAEIAWKVGFGSPTYFIKCFHDYFGYPPGEYIKYAPENNAGKSDTFTDANQLAEEKIKAKRRFKKPVLALLGIVIILAASLYIYKNFFEPEPDKSIAVLPFKNLSEEINNQYFADGIMDEILNHLSGIREFTVISRTSSERYRDSKKSLPQIAKELGVSFILEGSVQKFDNRLKVIVQLNDKKDKHIWSDSFERELTDIFELQSVIAKQIALELKIVLSPQEIEQIDKRYTENLEAYSLYQEGRFYWLLEGEINVRRSIELYNQALVKDSNYTLAYAGLADAYRRLEWHKHAPKNEAITKCREYALKASQLDENLAVVQTTLGSVAMNFDWDWNLAEKRFKRALEINPNHAEAHKEISKCYDIIGRREEARKHINKAIILNPFSGNYHWQSYHYYLKQGDYINAMKESEKMFHMSKDHFNKSRRNFDIYYRQNKEFEAVNELKKWFAYKSPEMNIEILDSIYNSSGIEGIIRFRIEYDENKEIKNYLQLARLYTSIDDKYIALDYLEQAFENGYTELIRIKFEQDFIKLRTEPRFLALLEKLNLGGY